MNNNQINGQKNNKEAYCPNPIFNNGTVSIGEFKTIEDAMNFPMQEIWCINRTQDNKFNSYVSQGCRLLIICDWGKSIQDSQKFVVALISKSGKITYWDLNDLPINTKQYENSIDNDALTAIFAVADELYRNNNQLNCNLNMNKKLIRLTESDLHRIVKQSVNKILKESSYDSMGNFNKESNNSDVRERLTDEITKISQEMSRSMSTIDGVAKRAVGDEEITNRARIVINALIDACRKMRNVTQLIDANRWDLPA